MMNTWKLRGFSWTRALLMVLMVFGTTAAVDAQAPDGRVEGVVQDSTDAVIPGAKVVLKETNKGLVVYTGTTDSTGHFLVSDVPPGDYVVIADSKGFEQSVLTDITVTLGQSISLNVRLRPGNSDVSVTVNASAQELLDKSTSGLSTLITPSEVDDLPLPNRDVTNLLELVPGVSYGGDSTSVATYQLSVNGSRTLGTEVLLDGMSMIENVTGQITPLPSPDALGQLRFSTLNAPAEYGRTSGAVLQIATRSGTNDFHIRLYELFRNEALNANGYFNNLRGIRRLQNRYNQYGAVITGPIVVPKLYNGRNRSFFMVNFDQTLHVTPNTNIGTTPPPAFRNGDFSSASAQIYDPQTGKQFPGNVIPSYRLDPAAVKIMALLPGGAASNGTVQNQNLTTNNYVAPAPYKTPSARYTARIDQSFGERTRVFATAERYLNPNPRPVVFSALLNPNYGKDNGGGWVGIVGITHVWTPNIVSELRYGFTDQHDDNAPTGHGASLADLENTLGIASLPENVTPEFAINGYTTFGTAVETPTNNDSMTYMLDPSVTIVHGRHAIKAGVGLRWDQYNTFQPHTAPQGYFDFTGSITNPSHGAYAGAYAMADFMLGLITQGLYEIPEPRTGRRNQNWSAFVQDDWRVSSKLTLNLGIRYEYESPVYLNNNLYSRFDLTTGNLLAAGFNANKYLNLKSPHLDIMPRIGFAYSLSNTLVVRGAFGTFYSPLLGLLGSGDNFPGYDGGANFGSPGPGTPQPFALSQGFPLTGIQVLTNPFAIFAGATPASPAVTYGQNFGPLSVLPHIEERNFGFQKQLPKGFVVEANYVGTHGLHLPYSIPVNVPAYTSATLAAQISSATENQQLSPFPNVQGGIGGVYMVGDSTYNSVQLLARRQFSPRLSVTGSFTWAHSIDDASGVFNFSQPNGLAGGQYPEIPSLRRLDRSSSSFDVRHNTNFAVQLGSKSRHFVLDGWKLSPVFVARTGLPINISQNNEFPGVVTQRPNRVTNADLGTALRIQRYVNGTTVQYLALPSSANFPLTPSGPIFVGSGSSRTQVVATGLGNLGRNSISSPGEVNVNMSLQRTFKLMEHGTFQFRVDSFNLLNHTNFQAPDTVLSIATSGTGAAGTASFTNSGFGQISGNYTPRYLQLSAKVAF